MSKTFWVRRFATVLGGAFAIITGAQLIKGYELAYSAGQGALWGLIAASIFVGARIYQSGKGQHCALCKDTPEMQEAKHHEAQPRR